MRVNIYHEELDNEAEIVWAEPRPGVKYCGLRIYQKSIAELHHTAADDDRSAVTFWVGSLDEADQFLNLLEAALYEARRGAQKNTERLLQEKKE